MVTVRKATWGAILLAVFALSTASPIREIGVLHRILGLALFAGYLLLSFDPPTGHPRQRKFLLAGIICSLVAFVLAVLPLPVAANVVARALAVASVALPLWLVARPPQFAFVAAGALALVTGLVTADLYATSVHAYAAAGGAVWVAWILHAPATAPGQPRKPKRKVVVSNIVTLSAQEKAAALARIEKRFQAGEIPEHKYWDLRQEIESR